MTVKEEYVKEIKEMLDKFLAETKCRECKKDWTKCGKCPVMMKFIEEHKAIMRG